MKIKLLLPLLIGVIMLEASDIKKENPKEQIWKTHIINIKKVNLRF